MTGQHHAREHVTANVVLFTLLKLLHGGLVHRQQEYVNLLLQNKYFVIPSVNVDGVAFIEEEYIKTGRLPEKRKNMNIQSKECSTAEAGVDLNRNYDFNWGIGDTANDKECDGETYGGKAPFSEPETRAIRDFVASKKDELRFVYNLHCSGNQYIIPFNGVNPNNADVLQPQTLQLFQEIVNEADFPMDYQIGPASETLGMKAGGSSGDWINWNFQIPASEVEIGTWEEIPATDWMPVSKKVSFKLATESWSWISYTYRKIGNQITLKPIGYKFDQPAQTTGAEPTFLQTNDSRPADASSLKAKNGSISLAQKSSRKH